VIFSTHFYAHFEWFSSEVSEMSPVYAGFATFRDVKKCAKTAFEASQLRTNRGFTGHGRRCRDEDSARKKKAAEARA
jgi:hypothetical protein